MSAIPITIQALLADAGVRALVADRISPGISPQGGTLPDIVVHLISDETYEGLARTTDMRQARVSIEARARTFTESNKVAEAAISALKNRRGTILGRYAVFMKAVTDVTQHADDASVFQRITDQYVTYTG